MWQKSIGGLAKKNSLLGIVKKKSSKTGSNTAPSEQSRDERTKTEHNKTTTTTHNVTPSIKDDELITVREETKIDRTTTDNERELSSKPTALGMLGAYSDTSSDDSN